MVAEQSQHDPWAAGRLTPGQLEDLLRRFEGLAVLPTVSAAVLEAMDRQPSAGAGGLCGELLDILQADPVLGGSRAVDGCLVNSPAHRDRLRRKSLAR